MKFNVLMIFALVFCLFSCIEKDLYKGGSKNDDDKPKEKPLLYEAYLYPFANEVKNPVVEITIETDGKIDLNTIASEVPPLKYNKSWLFLLTQDDCKQAAFSRTWAAINGKPITGSYLISKDDMRDLYYDMLHLYAGDIPPGSYLLGKTLGSTDGAGNEVRFHLSTTLSPEEKWMHRKVVVNKGSTRDYYRFFMQDGLVWDNVKEMLNYGTGIAFHDVLTDAVNNADSIAKHYVIAQDSILKNLKGRGSKFLVEPNGNKTYITAAAKYDLIQTITLQADGIKLIPFQVKQDLTRSLIERVIFSNSNEVKRDIEATLKKDKENREAILAGVHGTDKEWIELLQWLNDKYGKDGDDSLWFPNQEEYYEYNYYRIHSKITKTASGNTLKISVSLPTGQYFYYPSITLNLKGLKKESVKSIQVNDVVSGLSYADYEQGLMVNVDCRKFMKEHAEHYVSVYEKDRTKSKLDDATYFVNMLKESPRKKALLERLK